MTRSNTRVKEAAKLSRRSVRTERRLFLADGPKAVEAALTRGCAVEVFVDPARELQLGGVLDLLERSERVTLTWVDPKALDSLSDSVTPAGVVAVCELLDVSTEQALVGEYAVICAEVSDPGNAGTVIRCADASGAGGVVLAGDSVDLHNPKTIRASVGSAFQLPIATGVDPAEAVRAAQAAGFVVLAADGAGEVSLFELETVHTGPVAWLLGNEAHGLSSELLELADHRVSIPIFGRAESLNLATAAAVALYTSARLRRSSQH